MKTLEIVDEERMKGYLSYIEEAMEEAEIKKALQLYIAISATGRKIVFLFKGYRKEYGKLFRTI